MLAIYASGLRGDSRVMCAKRGWNLGTTNALQTMQIDMIRNFARAMTGGQEDGFSFFNALVTGTSEKEQEEKKNVVSFESGDDFMVKWESMRNG